MAVAARVEPLRAPFPYFGGKRRAAPLIWERLGDVRNYVEPFAGSMAVLLARPHEPRLETVNDVDGFIANFWRAVKADPGGLAAAADWPINETDLHAWHAWLTQARNGLEKKLRADPRHFDAEIAGRWAWGISMWIGSGWCVRPEWSGRAHAGRTRRGLASGSTPHLSNGAGMGVQSKRPALNSRGGHGVHARLAAWDSRKRPNLTNGGRGVHAMPKLQNVGGRALNPSARPEILEWMHALAERLRHVRVCCGDWKRVVKPSVTFKISGDKVTCGVLLDPPYDVEAGRDAQLYAHDPAGVSAAAREWAIANGDNPLLRIALCGYEGEHDMPAEWDCVAWKAVGGYGNQRGETRGKANAQRERIWFSPHCLPGTPPLFACGESEGGAA